MSKSTTMQIFNKSKPKKNLILHIGTHKTGTSAIQNLLEENRSKLASDSVWYAKTNREPHPHLSKHTSLFHAIRQGKEAFIKEKRYIETEFANSGCDTLILSEEGFCEMEPEVTEFMSLFADSFEITTICYLRRQDLFIESFWNQRCREGLVTKNAADFSRSSKSRSRMRYAKMLSKWERFSEVRAFEYDKAKSDGIAHSFAQTVGISLPELCGRANVSPGMNCALAISLLNKLDRPFDRKEITKAFNKDKTRFALGSNRRIELLAEVAQQNKLLTRRYGVEFSQEMPQEPSGPLTALDNEVLALALWKLVERK